jgi:HTH-type transcriptional regulator/antitoxin HigA
MVTNITPLKNRREYRRALKEIESLMHAKRSTRAGDRLDMLVRLVEIWDREHSKLDVADPIME